MDTSRPHAPAPRPRLFRPAVGPSVLLAFAALAGACSDTFRGAPRAEQMFEGFAVRFAPNVYDARYNVARTKLAQSALVPSRVFDDTAVWESRANVYTRTLLVSGTTGSDGRYRLETRSTLPVATRLGDTRHTILLEQVSPNQFRWDTNVEMGIGAVTPDDIANALVALMRAPEGQSEKELREEYRTAFPKATAAFGRGFSLDSIVVVPAALGTTTVTLRIGFHPELMKASHPGLAGYLDKYLGPAKYHLALFDRVGGAALFDVVGRDRAITLRYRLQQGKLVSLLGPPRPWSDSLTLMSDVSLKVKLFTVGFHELATDFVISNMSSEKVHERAWTVVAQHEPKWDLPFITERLIRSPLRRPFEGAGAMFRLAVRDSGDAQTMFARRARLDVQESAIMRFLGSLASHAIGDLDGAVEADEHAFLHEGFVALMGDLKGR